MCVVIGGFVVSQPAQRFDDSVLRLRLARINDVVDFRDIAEVWMVFFALHRGNPAIMPVRITIKPAVSEVAPQQSKLPHVVSDVFANVSYGSVGANDHLLVFFGNFASLCVPCVLRG